MRIYIRKKQFELLKSTSPIMKYMRMGQVSALSLCFPVLFNCEHESLRSKQILIMTQNTVAYRHSILRSWTWVGFLLISEFTAPQKASCVNLPPALVECFPGLHSFAKAQTAWISSLSKGVCIPWWGNSVISLTHLKNHSQKQTWDAAEEKLKNTHFSGRIIKPGNIASTGLQKLTAGLRVSSLFISLC